MSNFQLKIPAIADHIDVVRLCIFGIASKMGFSYEDIEDMKVAVSEACNNAILHWHRDEGDPAVLGSIQISFEMLDHALSIEVKDDGPGFDYTNISKKALPLHENEIADLRIGGLGIYLMQALMDRVEVRAANCDESGTVVHMTKIKPAVPLAEEG